MYSKFIQENSQQGKRNDLADDSTCGHCEHKLNNKSSRPKTRDKISKHLGISSSVFERYRSIAKLDDKIINTLGKMLDEKKIGFMAAHKISQLKLREIELLLNLLESDPEIKVKTAGVKLLFDNSKDKDLTREEIRKILL